MWTCKTVVVTSALLSASVAAFGQTTPSQSTPSQSMPSQSMPSQSMPSQSMSSPNAGNASDDDFVAKAATAGHEEVADARQALKDSNRADVKRVAAMLRRDHMMADHKLAQIAKHDGLSLPPHGSIPQSTATNYSDSDYIQSQIKAHEEAIALFQNESQNGQDPQLKAFAQKTLPKLEHHLQALQALANV